ncbi:hypothetical protein CXG81DRAFT_21465 [Caulochytrium protostelioides]|uniref:Uncharacterized protein n=1 Tax=Caulochytrium protostelioides TaxID=1555241 RepID=A0A4P9WWB7_9FUNG|nr:hypothetical protein CAUPRSCDRAFT_11678 [Caulochytrium protostelioides]RKO98284.1 hypothetical protein CXG81DRAFT_21465 [Caulochytrium protostelioides]|eukprot:RKO98284.1 hypothetical protein CXG81DRAFT_21465 [Caulochytrium protostelioides]
MSPEPSAARPTGPTDPRLPHPLPTAPIAIHRLLGGAPVTWPEIVEALRPLGGTVGTMHPPLPTTAAPDGDGATPPPALSTVIAAAGVTAARAAIRRHGLVLTVAPARPDQPPLSPQPPPRRSRPRDLGRLPPTPHPFAATPAAHARQRVTSCSPPVTVGRGSLGTYNGPSGAPAYKAPSSASADGCTAATVPPPTRRRMRTRRYWTPRGPRRSDAASPPSPSAPTRTLRSRRPPPDPTPPVPSAGHATTDRRDVERQLAQP